MRTSAYFLLRFAIALVLSLIVYALGLLRVWPVGSGVFLFYVGVFFGLLLIVLAISLWRSAGICNIWNLRMAGSSQEKRMGAAFLLLITGTSCTLVALVWHLIFPSHLRVLSGHIYLYDNVDPLFFLSSETVFLPFLITWGLTISAMSLGHLWAANRSGRPEHFERYAGVCRDAGLALFEAGVFLPLSTAMLNYLSKIGDSSTVILWTFPYWPHGVLLITTSLLLLAASHILGGASPLRGSSSDRWRPVATLVTVLVWLLSPEWFFFTFSFFPMFLATETMFRYATLYLVREPFFKHI